MSILFILSKLPSANHMSRHPCCDDVIGQGFRYDTTGPDDGPLPYVGQHDGSTRDPGPFTNRHERADATLIADRDFGVVDEVCLAAARYVNAGREEHDVLHVDKPQ